MPESSDSVNTDAVASSAASPGVSVLVVGMHRSGTSAVTHMLTALGLNPPRADDLPAPSQWNERGNQESRSLVQFNDRILHESGGSWSAPPRLVVRWEDGDPFRALEPEARRLVAATAGARPSVWKDPRVCLLLPFWRSVIGQPEAAVFVYRDPVEVARSLQARNGFPITHGLALWERYVRSAASNLDGIPTIAVAFDQFQSDPAAWCREVVDFLAGLGVRLDPARVGPAAERFEARLVHQRTGREQSALVGDPLSVLDVLQRLQGSHLPWQPPQLDSEPSWVEDVLSMRRELEQARRDGEAARATGLGQLARVARRTGARISRETVKRLGRTTPPEAARRQQSSTS